MWTFIAKVAVTEIRHTWSLCIGQSTPQFTIGKEVDSEQQNPYSGYNTDEIMRHTSQDKSVIRSERDLQ